MLTVYRLLLRVYPSAHRSEFGEEMLAVFRAVQSDARKKGSLARLRFCASEIRGVLSGALWEHARAISGFDRPPLFFPRRFMMRSEFRFPKSTVALMAVVLACVVWAIEKATAIRVSVPDSSQHVGPIHSTGFTFLPTMLLILTIAGVAGVLGWGVLFIFHRAGVHRLADVDPSAGT